MTIYNSVLFVHAVAVLTLTGCLGIEALLLHQLRRASGREMLTAWLSPLTSLTAGTAVSLGIVEVTGAYLTQELHSWEFAWPKLAFWGVIAVGLLGGLSGRILRQAKRYCAESFSVPFTANDPLQSDFLNISLCLRIFLVAAILLLTIVKYDVLRSTAIIGAAVLLGLLSGIVSIKLRKKLRVPDLTDQKQSAR